VRLPDPPLLLITDRRQACAPLTEIVQAACAAGCRWISVREKDLAAPEQVALAQQLRTVVRRHGARLSLHGAPEVAKMAGLDGVHLAAGADRTTARAIVGNKALVGVSVHRIEEAGALEPDLVDYAIAGPVRTTPSKPGYGPGLESVGLRALVEAACVPVIAIGGVEAMVVGELMRVGAAGIAVMGSVMRAANPMTTIAGLLAALAAYRQTRGEEAD
jgi:thiamine-phosphate pyrophosphorylase